MRRASAPRAIRVATRWASVWVFPVPAPATISNGPSPLPAASRCAGLSLSPPGMSSDPLRARLTVSHRSRLYRCSVRASSLSRACWRNLTGSRSLARVAPMSSDEATWSAVDDFINGALVPPDDALSAALRDSDAAGLPPISVTPAQGRLLHILAQTQGAKSILEVGTLGGYSTIWMARALPPGGRIADAGDRSGHREGRAREPGARRARRRRRGARRARARQPARAHARASPRRSTWCSSTPTR